MCQSVPRYFFVHMTFCVLLCVRFCTARRPSQGFSASHKASTGNLNFIFKVVKTINMSNQCSETSCALPMVDLNSANIYKCGDGADCIKLDELFMNSPAPISADTPESTTIEIARKFFAEFLGTCVLVTVIVGSGIMAQRLSPDNVGLQLLENGISVGLALVCLILMFGPVSG